MSQSLESPSRLRSDEPLHDALQKPPRRPLSEEIRASIGALPLPCKPPLSDQGSLAFSSSEMVAAPSPLSHLPAEQIAAIAALLFRKGLFETHALDENSSPPPSLRIAATRGRG